MAFQSVVSLPAPSVVPTSPDAADSSVTSLLKPIPDPLFSPDATQDYGPEGGAQTAISCPGCSPVPVSPNVPIFHSKPGATQRLMLDFDGHCFPSEFLGTCPGQTVPFSLDSTKTTAFTTAELAAIRKIWECVAEDFSPLDVDVTTEEPAAWSELTDARVVFDDHSGSKGDWWGQSNFGYSYSIGTFGDDDKDSKEPNIAYVWYENALIQDPERAKVVGDAASHEAGHLYGLNHYTVGTTDVASIMSNPIPLRARLAWIGDASIGDISELKIHPGFRADDYGDTIGAATSLPNGVGFSISGIIGRNSGGAAIDVDMFKLDVGAAGMVSAVVSVNPWVQLAPASGLTPDYYYANLDSKLTLLNSSGAQATDSSGALVPVSNPTTQDLLGFGARIAARLSPGTYYLRVESSDAWLGGLGTYRLFGARPDPNATSNAPRVTMLQLRNSAGTHGTYPLPAGSGLQLRTIPIGGANQIEISFSEPVSVQQDDLVLKRAAGSGSTVAFTGFAYNSADWTATWTFAPIGTDQVLLTLKGTGSTAVVDGTGSTLDGEWTNPSAMYQGSPTTNCFPSGNGSAGGDFVCRLTFLAGDTDCDGDVDTGDYNRMSSNFGVGTTWAQGDFDGDGDIDLSDFGLLQPNYNTTNYRAWP